MAKLCIMVRENIFAADQTAVEQREAGTGHHQDQRGAGEHPGVVAGGLRGFGGLLEIREPFIEVRWRAGPQQGYTKSGTAETA